MRPDLKFSQTFSNPLATVRETLFLRARGAFPELNLLKSHSLRLKNNIFLCKGAVSEFETLCVCVQRVSLVNDGSQICLVLPAEDDAIDFRFTLRL